MNFLATLSSSLLHLTLGSLLVVVVAEEGQVPLGTLVSEVSSVPALEARDLVQSLESTGVPVCPAHWMHSVIRLCVRHEGFPQLIILLFS